MGETSYLAARAEQRGAWCEVVHMLRDMVMGQRAGWRFMRFYRRGVPGD